MQREQFLYNYSSPFPNKREANVSNQQPKRIVFELGESVRVSPPIWFDNAVDWYPGDFSKRPPYGSGVYGYQSSNLLDPLKNAPKEEDSGGVVYFGNGISKADFEAMMRIMHVDPCRPSKDFAVFTALSKEPGKEGCLTQMRTVSKFGLRFMFKSLSDADYEKFAKQGVSTVDALWAFVEHERECWGTSFTEDEKKGLRGLFGGDGDFRREQLAFGFMVENQYHGVYRIWSRAWLVTK